MLALLSAFALAPLSAAAAPKESKAFKNLPVSGTLADGGTFTGKLTITEVGYDAVEGLTVSGVLKGQATDATGTKTHIEQAFSNVGTTLSDGSAGAVSTQAVCDILFLDLGPISLDLLGLTVDLSRIILDINAVSGAGNLLGNLLCAIVGLLDPGTGLLNFLSDLARLLDLLGQLNNLIG
jgi:hypothetical protein